MNFKTDDIVSYTPLQGIAFKCMVKEYLYTTSGDLKISVYRIEGLDLNSGYIIDVLGSELERLDTNPVESPIQSNKVFLSNFCECGAHAIKDASHSGWCPLYA